jgi:putative membrane protein
LLVPQALTAKTYTAAMKSQANIYKGLAAGVAGGLAGAVVMNQFQALWGKLMANEERPHGAQSLQQGSPRDGIGRELDERGVDDPDDNAAVRTANAVSEFVLDHHLTKSEKETAGAVAHYAMGATSGAIYGALAEVMPVTTVAEGLPFGAAVWLVADEGVVPALGLSRKSNEYPASVHAYAFASHLVYGLTTELVRRALRRAM